MQTLRIQPMTAMFQPFVKEAAPGAAPIRGKTGFEKAQPGAQFAFPGMGVDSANPSSPAPVGTPNAQPVSDPAAQANAPAAQAVQDPAQSIQALMQSAKNFGNQFNQEIRAYNQHVKQVHQSIAMLQKIDWNTSTVDPATVIQQASALQQTLDSATADQAQDMAFLQQLSTQAAQLAQSAGGAGMTMEQAMAPAQAAPGAQAPAAPAPGMAEQVGKGVGQVAKAPGRAMNWLGNQMGRGVDWARQQGNQFGQGFTGAESDETTLTASMGSAQSLIAKSHNQS